MSSPLYCENCGAEHRPEANFCSYCRHALQGSISSDTGQLLPDHLLNLRYRIVSQVGKGGFGAVYKAEDLDFEHRYVAVKEMSQRGMTPEEITAAAHAFKDEAHLLASLTHQSLPSIYDHLMEAGRWYLVMDFIEGETLDERLHKARDQRLPLEDVLAIGMKLSTVLDYLHTREPPIIFRDLKPANVMLTLDGQLYLIDFGIARHFKPGQPVDTRILGSHGYAAPVSGSFCKWSTSIPIKDRRVWRR